MRKFLISKMTRERLDVFIADNASAEHTLDIGCASSPYSSFFPNRVGFDVADGEGVRVVGDAHHLPFRDGEFEQVLCTEVLEHLHTPQLAIDEMHRVLKKGGKLILTTRFNFPLHDTPGDYFRYTKYGIQHLLRDWDVAVIEEEASTMRTFAVLLQRVAFQTDVWGGKLTKAALLLFARGLGASQWLIKKEYGTRSKVAVRQEKSVMTSGYYVIARKK